MKKPLLSFLFLCITTLTVIAQPQLLRVKWIVPDEIEYSDKVYSTEKASLPIKLDIINTGGIRVDFDKLHILRNGKPMVFSSKKLGNARLSQIESTDYRYEHTIELEEGENRLEAELTIPGHSPIRSKKIIVNWLTGKPNLHIVSVGINYPDLNYPQNDAEKFFSLFKSQSGCEDCLFGNVEGTLLVTRERTMRASMGTVMQNLESRGLRPQDVLIIFFSGHGMIEQASGSFGLVGSDIVGGASSKYSLLRYNEDILAYLEKIACKRIVFLDACHSGGAGAKSRGDLQQIQEAISATPPQIITMSSSSREQLSHENAVWKHGAFTKVLIEGLENGKADYDNNDWVTVQELADYLTKRVPLLVDSADLSPQNPRLIKPIEFDFSIFNYRNLNKNLIESDNPYDKIEANDALNDPIKHRGSIAVSAFKPNGKDIDYALIDSTMVMLMKKFPNFSVRRLNMDVNSAEGEIQFIVKKNTIIAPNPVRFGNETFHLTNASTRLTVTIKEGKQVFNQIEVSGGGTDHDADKAVEASIEQAMEMLADEEIVLPHQKKETN